MCRVPFAEIFRFTRRANHLYKFAPSHPTRGAYRDRHGRGVRMRWTRQRFACDGIAGRTSIRERSTARGREMLLRTAKSCGPDTPTLVSSSRSCVGPTGLRQNLNPQMTVAKEPGHRGEHEISRKAIACGNVG